MAISLKTEHLNSRAAGAGMALVVTIFPSDQKARKKG
jgi:hypothetical protein